MSTASTASAMNSYERRVRREIDEWCAERPDRLSRALELASLPLALAGRAVPQNASEAIERSVMGLATLLRDTSRRTYSEEHILREARELGIEARRLDELGEVDLQHLDELARRQFLSNTLAGALQGAGAGLGGPLFVVADLPAIFGVAMRVTQQIGASYGFDMGRAELAPLVLSIFNAGASGSPQARSAVLADARLTAELFGAEARQPGAPRAAAGAGEVLQEMAKGLPKRIAKSFTRRKIAQLVPVLGSLVGAGFNYWFISNTALSAHMAFRELYLTRKFATTGPDPGAQAD